MCWAWRSQRRRRPERGPAMTVRLLLSLFFALLGSAILLYVYAFASMVDPALLGWERQGAILSQMFHPAGGVGLTLMGLFFLAWSGYELFSAFAQRRPK